MIVLNWRQQPVPPDLKVRQVYAVAFDKHGRVLLKYEFRKGSFYYCLPGGTPETFDKDMQDTLRREFIEEVNTTLFNPIYIGYQEVIGDKDLPPYAQVRMAALIDTIGPKQPDPDNGITFNRILTTPEKAAELLNWGEIGEKIIKKAVEVAKENYIFEDISTEDKEV